MKAQIIRKPNRLKAKVSGSEHAEPGSVARELIARAHEVVVEYSEKYPAQAEIDLSRLLGAASAVMLAPEDCGERINRLRREAAEIMGQAETFGYVLLTRFARSLYDTSAGVTSVSADRAAFLQAHIDAIQLIIRSKITGDGGDIGKELIRSLVLAKAKFANGA